jgi:hypothetical protein
MTGIIVRFVTVLAFLSTLAFAQDEAVPLPKPSPSAKPKTTSTVSKSSGATLLILCDLECRWTLDGDSSGHLQANTSVKVKVEQGDHLLSVKSIDGLDADEQKLVIKGTAQTLVKTSLSQIRDSRVAKAEQQRDSLERERQQQQASAERERQEQHDLAERERQEEALAPIDRGIERYKSEKYSDALPFFQAACESRSALGCDYAGELYSKGNGVDEDDFKAVDFFRKGCDFGSAKACGDLGDMVEHGTGVSQDHRRAGDLYIKSCDTGYGHACTSLGEMLEDNEVIVGNTKAADWYRKGCDNGDKDGCEDLTSIQN